MRGIRLGSMIVVVASALACSSADSASHDNDDDFSSEPDRPSSESSGSGEGAAHGRGSSAAAAPGPAPASASASTPDAPPGSAIAAPRPRDTPDSNVPVEPGTLTAGTWDDNRNYDRFQGYRAGLADKHLGGLLPTTDEEHDSAHEAFKDVLGARETLDVALVIDTTGSMGDEIAYLQAEFLELSRAIEDAYPNAAQRWSLVVYRDVGDEYVVRSFDFRDSATEFREKLELQGAAGGGDTPEAPDAAFEALTQLRWRTEDSTARLAFWVADAPHHQENAEALADAIRATRKQNVHIYPVASSGVDELTEVTMRSAAQLTGGRYLFLTDDSGVGGTHKEPTLPCYFVTRLDDAILRMVDIELSGDYREPAAEEIVRRGGNPKDGACTLESGNANVF